MGTAFDVDTFVASCYEALQETNVLGAVSEIVERAVVTSRTAIGDTIATLHSSPTLTVQRLCWGPGALTDPHDHRMWAVVGVYAGEERNQFYRRTATTIDTAGDRLIAPGDVLALPQDVIHDAASVGSTWLGGLHVYGGDLFAAERSAWDPAGVERPYDEVAPQRRRMVECIGEVTTELARTLSATERHDILLALWSASTRLGRHLDEEEARQVVRETVCRLGDA